MAVVAAQVAVSTTATRLSADEGRDGTSLLVQAPAGATLFVGGSDVSSSAGFPIPPGQTLSVDLPSFDELFGLLAAGTGTASVLRVGA
jgi:hypothetical protein